MLKDVLSDEEIYCTLDFVISTILQYVPARENSSFPDKELLEQLQEKGYNSKTSWAFLRACHWHLVDNGIMTAEPSQRYHLNKKITEDQREKICMEIFSEYETYLQANYTRSLADPIPCYVPEKAPDSSPGFKPKYFSGGK